MESVDKIQTELQHAEDAIKITLKENNEIEITGEAALKQNLKTGPSSLKKKNIEAFLGENGSGLRSFLMEAEENKASILTEPHSVPDAQIPVLTTPTDMQESGSCPPPPSPATANLLVDEEKESKVDEKVIVSTIQPACDNIPIYYPNHNENVKIDEQKNDFVRAAEKFPWPGKTSIFGDLIRDMEVNEWKQHFKTRQQHFLPVETIIHEINTKYDSLNVEILHFGAHQIPNVYIKCSHWKNAASFHPPRTADTKTVKSWLRNVLGNTYIFGDLIIAEKKPSTVCTAILMFRPENILRDNDIRKILSNKVNGVSSENDLDTKEYGANAIKFPWPWPKDTPIFEIINEDLQLFPWKKHFKETIQFTMDIRKLVTSLKTQFMGRLKIRIEFKTSFRNENTLIPNLYIKTNTWEKAYVLHAPTHSTQQEGEHWLRNVLGNIYLFGHSLFVSQPTVDHTAMLLYMLNHRKDGINKMLSPPQAFGDHVLPNSTHQGERQGFERSCLYKHLTSQTNFRKAVPAPLPLPIQNSSSRSFNRQEVSNVREFKPRQTSVFDNNYGDIYAKYRSNAKGQRYGTRHETSHYGRESTHYDREATQYGRETYQYDQIELPRPISASGHGAASVRSFEQYEQMRQRYKHQLQQDRRLENYARKYRGMY